ALPAPGRGRGHREGGGGLRRRSDEAGRPGVSATAPAVPGPAPSRGRPFSWLPGRATWRPAMLPLPSGAVPDGSDGAPRPATATASGSIPPFASRDPTMSQLAYRRVLLKLSGEALMGDEDYGIDPKVIGRLAREVIEAQQAGAEIALVIGGGNIFRGA